MLYIKVNKLNGKTKIGNSDWFSKNDLYVKIKYNNEIRRTTVLWNEDAPTWNEAFVFEKSVNNKVIFELYDSDKWRPDELIFKEEHVLDIYNMEIHRVVLNGLEIDIGDIFTESKKKYHELLNKNTVANIKLEKIQEILKCKTAEEMGVNIK